MTASEDLTTAMFTAVRTGDVATLTQLLAEHPHMVSAPLGGRHRSRTPLHVATDWPGYFPNGPQVVRVLIEAGADPNARPKPGDETPLHWAASSDDVDVAEALIDGGADVDAPDGSIGTPLANAVGYGCWHVARLLVARGATVDAPWQAAALGMTDMLEELLGEQPDPVLVSQAFWHACSGGQRRTAESLLERGAELQWSPEYAEGTALDAASDRSTRQQNVISWLHDLGARSARAEADAEE